MVGRLVGAALRNREVVFLLAAALLVGGLYAARHSPLDVFPEFAPPIVEVQVEAPGLAAEDVEALVTRPLERALGGAPELATLRSSSIAGLAVLTAIYPYGTDPYRARQVVIERLALTAEQLPPGTRPAVSPLSSALTTILAIGMRGASPLVLRDLAEWTIRPRLLAVPGVANVVIYGGGIRQVQVTTTPERLLAARATLDDLATAAAAADAPGGSGFLDRGGQRLPTWLDGRLHGAGDLARAPLPGRNHVPVPLAAVADVGEGPAVAVGDAIVNGEPGVVLLVTKQPEQNVLAVTAAVEDALEAIVRALPADVRVERTMFRQASFVTHALGNLRRALLAGAVLVTLVLLVFTAELRAAMVSVVAIPLSLLAAVAVLLPGAVARHPEPPRLMAALRRRYERALARVLTRPAPVLAGSLAAVAVAVGLSPLTHLEFLPEFHETNFVMHMTGAPGVGFAESVRVGSEVGRRLLAVPGVRSVAQVIGRSTLSEDVWGPERSEMMVQLAPDVDAEAVTEALREEAGGVAGFAFDIKQFLNERIEELLGGAGAELVIRLRGLELPSLEQAAATLSERVAAVPGVVDLHAPGALAAPGLRIHPRRDDLLQYGVPAAAVERAVRSALGGVPVGRLLEGERQADVVLRVASDAAADPERFARLPLVTAEGRIVPLGAVADVEIAPLRTAIMHEDGVRTILVRLDARGRALDAVAHDVGRAVAATALPAGVYAEVGGEYAAAAAARQRLVGLGVLALLGIFVLLVLDFRSARLAALTMVNVPLAFVGGLAAVLLAGGGQLSLGAIVGFVTVFGITIRNGIVLIAYFQQEERAQGRALDHAGLVRAAADRLAPILMTALVTGIALLPLLLLGGRAGGEIEQPMALVIVGGLFTSTWLNLFVVPVWYGRVTTPAGAPPRGARAAPP